MQHNIWDVIVVGGGPAGCSAAIVLARSNRRVMIIDEGKQRNKLSHGMHNYLTRDDILPVDYLAHAHTELDKYGVEIINARAVATKKLADKGFEIEDNTGNKYLCRRILLATGVTDNVPDIPGMQELWGRHVFHCPFCDGWECRNGTIALYSSKINGYGMAMALSQICSNVILFTDGARYLRPAQKGHLQTCKIEVISTPVKQLVYTDNGLASVELVDGRHITCNSVFVNHGHRVNSELLEQLDCRRTKKGAAITNRQQQTSVQGVYVAGDASFDMHFVVVAAAEGVKAAVAIHNDLLKTDNLRFE